MPGGILRTLMCWSLWARCVWITLLVALTSYLVRDYGSPKNRLAICSEIGMDDSTSRPQRSCIKLTGTTAESPSRIWRLSKVSGRPGWGRLSASASSHKNEATHCPRKRLFISAFQRTLVSTLFSCPFRAHGYRVYAGTRYVLLYIWELPSRHFCHRAHVEACRWHNILAVSH